MHHLSLSLARLVLKRYRPLVIGVTGSVGKTTTQGAIATVLAKSGKRIRASHLGHGRKVDIVAVILGCAKNSLSCLFRSLRLLILPKSRSYPEVLVLEYAVDRPGAMKSLLDLVTPTIGVVTAIAPIHLERFETLEKLTKEYALFARAIGESGTLVLAGDDERVRTLGERARAQILTFGTHEGNMVQALEIRVTQEQEGKAIVIRGTNFKLKEKGSAVPAFLPGVLGGPHVHAALAAAAVGSTQGLHLVEISQALAHYDPPPGRMRLLRGIKQTLIVDDSYDASHVSCMAALAAGTQIQVDKPQESFAVIGDLLHLGGLPREEHQKLIAEEIVQSGLDYVVTVGHDAAAIGRFAREAGMPEAQVYHFDKPDEAGAFLKSRLEEGDVLFVTGAKRSRMETIVRELLAEPQRAKELLVRQ